MSRNPSFTIKVQERKEACRGQQDDSQLGPRRRSAHLLLELCGRDRKHLIDIVKGAIATATAAANVAIASLHL